MSAVSPWMMATSSILQLSGSSGSGGISMSCRPTFCLRAPVRHPNCRWALAKSTEASPFSRPSPACLPKVSGKPRTTAWVKVPYGHMLAMSVKSAWSTRTQMQWLLGAEAKKWSSCRTSRQTSKQNQETCIKTVVALRVRQIIAKNKLKCDTLMDCTHVICQETFSHWFE